MVRRAGGSYGDPVIRDLLRPWREATTWWSLTHLLLDVFVGTVTFSRDDHAAGDLARAAHHVPAGAARSSGCLRRCPGCWPASSGPASTRCWASGWPTRSRRSRPGAGGAGWWSGRSPGPGGGRSLYQLLALPLGLFTLLGALLAWCGSVGLLLAPLYVGSFPDDTAHFGWFDVTQGWGSFGVAVVGAVALVFGAPWVTRLLAWLDLAVARLATGAPPQGRAGREGDPAGDQPGGRGRQRRGRAPPHRARPARRRPAAAGGAGHGTGRGPRAARRGPGGRPPAGGRRPRGGQGRAQGDPRPGAGHPPGDPRGPWARRRPVRRGGPLAGPGDAGGRRGRAAAAGGREHRLLRRQRGAGQRRPPRRRHPGRRGDRPGAGTGWWSRCATTAGAAPPSGPGTGLAGLRRPGHRARGHRSTS